MTKTLSLLDPHDIHREGKKVKENLIKDILFFILQVITKMEQNWENKLALLKLEVKQHENTYESLNSQLEDLR